MSESHNTVFLRLEGPLQAWGGDSRFVIRDTVAEPVKSGIVGLICGCKGLQREKAKEWLPKLNALRMGVRIDHPGTRWADYHTVGARYGVMNAKGEIKRTGNTQHSPIETLETRRFYLCDASFLVALQGEPDTIAEVSQALADPVWPPFLGRKCCPPSLPIHAGTASFDSLKAALDPESQPWRCRIQTESDGRPQKLRLVLEWRSGERAPLPLNALPRMDEVVSFRPPVHQVRYVVEDWIACPEGEPMQTDPPPPPRGWADYNSRTWKEEKRPARLQQDRGLCVFCKRPAETVHHVDYSRAPGGETMDDLRSLCRLCHDAITMLEYGMGLREQRIDPTSGKWRAAIQSKINDILCWRSLARRRLREEED